MSDESTRVLLVEDNPADVRLIEARLKASVHVFSIEKAAELSSALTALIHHEFDVIFLDLTLDDSQGIETVHAVLRIAPHLPVVVLSGHEDLGTAMNCVKAGASSYVVKTSELSTAVLEREALYAKERAQHIAGLRLLLHQSMLATLGSGSAWAIHADRIDTAFSKVRSYLASNHPVALDQFNATIEEQLIPTVLRELRQFTVQDVDVTLRPKVDLLSKVDEISEQLKRARRIVRRQWHVLMFASTVILCLIWFLIEAARKE